MDARKRAPAARPQGDQPRGHQLRPSRFRPWRRAPRLLGYFPAFDWVAFVGLFGALAELPFHFPQLCLDIKQWAIELGDPELPHQKGSRHHALADARWTKEAWTFLANLHPAGAERRAFGHKNLP